MLYVRHERKISKLHNLTQKCDQAKTKLNADAYFLMRTTPTNQNYILTHHDYTKLDGQMRKYDVLASRSARVANPRAIQFVCVRFADLAQCTWLSKDTLKLCRGRTSPPAPVNKEWRWWWQMTASVTAPNLPLRPSVPSPPAGNTVTTAAAPRNHPRAA